MAAVAAGPVFRLLAAKDLGTASDDYNADGPNWKYFIPWADKMLARR